MSAWSLEELQRLTCAELRALGMAHEPMQIGTLMPKRYPLPTGCTCEPLRRPAEKRLDDTRRCAYSVSMETTTRPAHDTECGQMACPHCTAAANHRVISDLMCKGTGKSTRGWWREASGQLRDRCPDCRKYIVTGARVIPAHLN